MPEQIDSEDRLIRRIPKKPSHLNNGRITSACFKTKNGEDGLSAELERLVSNVKDIYSPETHTLGVVQAELLPFFSKAARIFRLHV